MSNTVTHTVRVFANESGEFGSSLGIIIDGSPALSISDRKAIARKLGYSETVFVDDAERVVVSIYNFEREIAFAGHAMLGVAWFFNANRDVPLSTVYCAGGSIPTWTEGDVIYISAPLSSMPPWHIEPYTSVELVESVTAQDMANKAHTVIWAWIDEAAGIVRARTFAPDWDIPEDEANGSGSMLLASQLNRALIIHHGKGSIIYARPDKDGYAVVGGRVVKDSYND
jgi:predicted PhzF superfamily epimerase YddE/YHI9